MTLTGGNKFTEASKILFRRRSCVRSTPRALKMREFPNAVSIGGGSDTIAAIAGSVAEAPFGIPEEIAIKSWSYLPRTCAL